MTLEAAVAVLNREHHRDREDWVVYTTGSGMRYAHTITGHLLREFEACAIAAAYEAGRADAQAAPAAPAADAAETALSPWGYVRLAAQVTEEVGYAVQALNAMRPCMTFTGDEQWGFDRAMAALEIALVAAANPAPAPPDDLDHALWLLRAWHKDGDDPEEAPSIRRDTEALLAEHGLIARSAPPPSVLREARALHELLSGIDFYAGGGNEAYQKAAVIGVANERLGKALAGVPPVGDARAEALQEAAALCRDYPGPAPYVAFQAAEWCATQIEALAAAAGDGE